MSPVTLDLVTLLWILTIVSTVVALLPGTNVQGAMVVAESVRCAISEHPVAVLGHNIPVTVSVGVHVGIPGQAPYTTEAMIAASDRALYEAKAQGRNRVIAQ